VTSRLNEGEASCVLLAQAVDIDALISDDLKAMHQLRQYAQIYEFDLGLAAALIQALVLRGKLRKEQALESLERIAERRDWMGRPIYKAYQKIVASTMAK
jgi:predicted nucleic acid-binding protein